VPAAAAGDEGYLGRGGAVREDFVGQVAGYAGVEVRDAQERGGNEVCGGVDEVFCYLYISSVDGRVRMGGRTGHVCYAQRVAVQVG
jgi:hypothetical protein